mgnify:CR=1 FL=1
MHAKTFRTNLSAVIFLLTINALGTASLLNAAEPGGKTGGGLLLVANKGDHTLGIIDPTAGRQIATVAEDGVTGHEVVASPDGKRAFVPIYGNAGVGKPGTDVAPDRAGAGDDNSHEVFVANACATMRR